MVPRGLFFKKVSAFFSSKAGAAAVATSEGGEVGEGADG
jgi:hypothetical protein